MMDCAFLIRTQFTQKTRVKKERAAGYKVLDRSESSSVLFTNNEEKAGRP